MVDVKAGGNCQCTFMKCKETENKNFYMLTYLIERLREYQQQLSVIKTSFSLPKQIQKLVESSRVEHEQ